MRIDEYVNHLSNRAKHCPLRARCPLAFLCASRESGRWTLPSIEAVERDDMMWTDLSSRPKVYVVRSGLLLSTVYANDNSEIPYGLFGPGFLTGIMEPYSPLIASNFYYFRSIVPGEVCSFDSAEVTRWLNPRSVVEVESLTTAIMLNQTTANYGQMLTLAHRSAHEKVASVLVRVANRLSQDPSFDGSVPVSHADIALIASVERATASRELKKLSEEGLIELGYRLIVLKPALFEKYGSLIEAKLPFYDFRLTR